MARIRKSPMTGDEVRADQDPQTLDDIRRFVDHAADLIAAQDAVRVALEGVQVSLEKAAVSYDRTALALARREREGITVHLDATIDVALRRIQTALAAPVARAEAFARETRLAAALAGLAGGIIGAASIILLIIFRII